MLKQNSVISNYGKQLMLINFFYRNEKNDQINKDKSTKSTIAITKLSMLQNSHIGTLIKVAQSESIKINSKFVRKLCE